MVVAYSVSRKLFREVTVRELLCSMINTGHPARRARLAYYEWLVCQSINQRNYTSDGWSITLSRGNSSRDRPWWRISYDGLLRRVFKRRILSLPQDARAGGINGAQESPKPLRSPSLYLANYLYNSLNVSYRAWNERQSSKRPTLRFRRHLSNAKRRLIVRHVKLGRVYQFAHKGEP